MKGVLQPDHIPLNKYELTSVITRTIVFTEISGIEEELQVTELPDRTFASGGNTMPVEFTVKVPMHHSVDVNAMETWFQMGQGKVLPGYKQSATLIQTSLSGKTKRVYALSGVFVSARSLPDLSMEDQGDMAIVEFTLRADDIEFIPTP